MPKFYTMQEAAKQLQEAMSGDDAAKMESAWENVAEAASQNAYEKLSETMSLYEQSHDDEILAQRGVRKLTTKEEKWYGKLIDAMKSGNPKQAFVDIIGSDKEDDVMPETILEDVFRNLTNNHPLLSRINTQYVQYQTKWILNNHTTQKAIWGAITDEITQEIKSDLKVVDLKQNKLSCFVILEKGMVDLGPEFLDSYIRDVMADSMATGLVAAVIGGTGKGEPAGMDRNIAEGNFNDATGWAQKEAVAVTSFEPEEYGKLLANFAYTEKGIERGNIGTVMLICNTKDYFTKVMPATTVLNGNGEYVQNLFPHPTDVVMESQVPEGKALLVLPDEYTLFVGQAARNNVIEYSDEYRFLEDQRVFKVVQYADGIAYDNTSCQLLDISGLEPAYLNVKIVGGDDEDLEKA